MTGRLASVEVIEVDIDWRRRFLKRKDTIQDTSFNVDLILENDPRWLGVVRWCDLTHRLVKARRPPVRGAAEGDWIDNDTTELRYWIAENYGWEPGPDKTWAALVAAAKRDSFHPIRDYLRGLAWDGVPRLATWLYTYLGAEDEIDADELSGLLASQREAAQSRRVRYLELVGTQWLLSAVARAIQPGCKADHVLILEGVQGLGKSSVYRALAGEAWVTDSPVELGTKEGMEQIRGKWVVELAELDSFHRAESTRAKMFFSSPVDRFREPYGRASADYPRQCVFGGSTNASGYLKDTTGNRRYWPVHCRRIDLDAMRRDRDQLWAEAVHRYDAGDPWWPTREQQDLVIGPEQGERTAQDAWAALISEWLDDPLERERVFVTLPDLFGVLRIEPAHMRPPEQQRLGQIMQGMGWKRVRRGGRGQRVWGYERPTETDGVPG